MVAFAFRAHRPRCPRSERPGAGRGYRAAQGAHRPSGRRGWLPWGPELNKQALFEVERADTNRVELQSWRPLKQLGAPFRLSDCAATLSSFREPPLLIEAVDQPGRLETPSSRRNIRSCQPNARSASRARQRLVIPRQIIGRSNRLKTVRGIVQVDPVPIDLRAVDRSASLACSALCAGRVNRFVVVARREGLPSAGSPRPDRSLLERWVLKHLGVDELDQLSAVVLQQLHRLLKLRCHRAAGILDYAEAKETTTTLRRVWCAPTKAQGPRSFGADVLVVLRPQIGRSHTRVRLNNSGSARHEDAPFV